MIAKFWCLVLWIVPKSKSDMVSTIGESFREGAWGKLPTDIVPDLNLPIGTGLPGP